MKMSYGSEVIQLYTIDEARELIAMERRETRRRKATEAAYYAKQKLVGAGMFAVSSLGCYALWQMNYPEGVLLLGFAGLGAFMVFTKEKVLTGGYADE